MRRAKYQEGPRLFLSIACDNGNEPIFWERVWRFGSLVSRENNVEV
jgi:hypothetical protein